MTELHYAEWGVGLLLAAVFAVALLESLAVVGLLVPGVGLLMALTLAATDASVPVALWVVSGAVGAFAGDGLSFWLGSKAGPAVHEWRIFRRHPEWINDGEHFFRRWGAWSIVIGRFIGPIRPVIPMVAGLLRMSPRTFWWANLLSAPAWACAYLGGMYWLGEAFIEHFGELDLTSALGLLVIASIVAVLVSVLARK